MTYGKALHTKRRRRIQNQERLLLKHRILTFFKKKTERIFQLF